MPPITLPAPSPNQTYVTISALEGGELTVALWRGTKHNKMDRAAA